MDLTKKDITGQGKIPIFPGQIVTRRDGLSACSIAQIGRSEEVNWHTPFSDSWRCRSPKHRVEYGGPCRRRIPAKSWVLASAAPQMVCPKGCVRIIGPCSTSTTKAPFKAMRLFSRYQYRAKTAFQTPTTRLDVTSGWRPRLVRTTYLSILRLPVKLQLPHKTFVRN
jgi:hypothetical protein